MAETSRVPLRDDANNDFRSFDLLHHGRLNADSILRLYTGAMTLANSATVNAKAFKSGYNPSAVAAASFTNTGTGKVYYVAKTGSDSDFLRPGAKSEHTEN